MDKWEKRIDAILGKDNERNRPNAIKFQKYLCKHLKFPIRITGIEDFPWEERYVVGGFPEKEYEKKKKTNPSYTDEFDLLAIENPNENDDCTAVIERMSDKKRFRYGLSWFKAMDAKSEAYTLLDTYSKWHCNY